VGERDFALPLDAVAEVSNAPRPRLIPLVPFELAGVVRFRGEPLPALDGGALLAGRALAASRHLIVLDRAGLRLGLRVTEVMRIERDVQRAVEIDADAVPAAAELADWVLLGGQPLGLVRPEALMERARRLFEQRSERGGSSCHGAF
jgi:chemotaxis signal transduction protein